MKDKKVSYPRLTLISRFSNRFHGAYYDILGKIAVAMKTLL